jgi:hypothetical protein
MSLCIFTHDICTQINQKRACSSKCSYKTTFILMLSFIFTFFIHIYIDWINQFSYTYSCKRNSNCQYHVIMEFKLVFYWKVYYLSKKCKGKNCPSIVLKRNFNACMQPWKIKPFLKSHKKQVFYRPGLREQRIYLAPTLND